jgi:Phosphotransferase enzyme family
MTAPRAEGVRVAYGATPDQLRAWVDATLGSPVVQATTQTGGFSPGVAARLVCADGTRAFCKAVHVDVNEFAADFHRREQRITAQMPATAPVPRLLAKYDEAGWVALLLQDIDGYQPATPWRVDELHRVVAALDELSRSLTPSPVKDIQTIAAAEAEDLGGWQHFAADGIDVASTPLDPWSARHLDRLATLEPDWLPATEGDTLLHLDLRADNLLIAADRVWVVDWPASCTGQPWVDLATFAPSVAMQGGPPPAELLALSETARRADRVALTAWVCALAGYFEWHSRLPAPPGLPTVRRFQAAQGEVALHWLQELTGWI